MNTFNNEASSNVCKKHEFSTKTEWSMTVKKDGCFKSVRKRWSECKGCMKQNQLTSKEIETFGAKGLHGRIEDILEDEQRDLAYFLLYEMYKGRNNKRWPALKRNLLNKYPYEILDNTISNLHDYGILKVHSERVKLRWVTKQVRYNELFESDILNFLGIEESNSPDWMTSPFPPLTTPKTKQGRAIHNLIIEQKVSYEHGEECDILDLSSGVVASSNSSPKGYFKLIRMLYGIYRNIEQDKKVYWKTFSQQMFGDTKVINKTDKRRLEKLFGENLESYGILAERNEVVLSGNFCWSYQGYDSTSRAFKDYISFPKDMIHNTKLTCWAQPYLLIIENPALFFSVVKSHMLDAKKWAIVLGNGFVSSKEMEVVRQACGLKVEEVYVWPDLDPYGYQIAVDINKKLNLPNVPVYLFGFSEELFKEVGVYKPLDSFDLEVVEQLLTYETLEQEVRNVLLGMKTEGAKAEQEILYSKISNMDINSLFLKSIKLYN